jgi:hypothetical protein
VAAPCGSFRLASHNTDMWEREPMSRPFLGKIAISTLFIEARIKLQIQSMHIFSDYVMLM